MSMRVLCSVVNALMLSSFFMAGFYAGGGLLGCGANWAAAIPIGLLGCGCNLALFWVLSALG